MTCAGGKFSLGWNVEKIWKATPLTEWLGSSGDTFPAVAVAQTWGPSGPVTLALYAVIIRDPVLPRERDLRDCKSFGPSYGCCQCPCGVRDLRITNRMICESKKLAISGVNTEDMYCTLPILLNEYNDILDVTEGISTRSSGRKHDGAGENEKCSRLNHFFNWLEMEYFLKNKVLESHRWVSLILNTRSLWIRWLMNKAPASADIHCEAKNRKTVLQYTRGVVRSGHRNQIETLA